MAFRIEQLRRFPAVAHSFESGLLELPVRMFGIYQYTHVFILFE
jgi:hypothetical protein